MIMGIIKKACSKSDKKEVYDLLRVSLYKFNLISKKLQGTCDPSKPKPGCPDEAHLRATAKYVCESIKKSGKYDPAIVCDQGHLGRCKK
jgi:hypothetical protein